MVRVGVVLAGYVAAFLLASAALTIRMHAETGPDVSGGMYAFGDTMFFLAVFGFLALFPTGVALVFLRRHRALWIVLSVLGSLVAQTGVIAAALYATRMQGLAALAPLRMLAAPLLALGFVVAAAISPYRFSRVILGLAAVAEAGVSAYMAVVWFVPMWMRR